MSTKQKIKNLSVIFLIFLTVNNVFAASKKNSKKTVKGADTKMTSRYEKEIVEEPEEPVDLSNATKIKVDKKAAASAFSFVDADVLKEVEFGSPQSIKRAIQKFSKAEIDYTENEKVFYNIAAQILSTAYPSEKPLDNIPLVSKSNNYLGIIKSAQSGIYEKNPNAKDFFEFVLPCLVLCTSTTKTDFYADAEESLQKAVAIKSDSILCHYLLGLLYKKQLNYDRALAEFDKATEANTVIYEVLLEKATCLIQLKKYDQVSNILDRLVIQFPSDLKVLKLYANTAFLMGDYTKAEQYASFVLQQNPSDLDFILFRAKIFVETAEYLKASSLLDVYAKTYPDKNEYLLLRSKIQKEWNKNLTAAVATIEKALTLYPNDSDIILYAAELASETGLRINGKNGGELAEMILSQDPENQKALQVSANAYFMAGNNSAAYSMSKKMMATSFVPQSGILQHIKICLALKYNDEAWKYAASIYDKSPNEPVAIQIYIETLIKTGRGSNASRLITNLLNQNPNSSMKSFLFYERSFLSNNEVTILSDLRSALISNPRNSDALFRMYQIYYGRKDYKKAQYYLKQVIALNPNDERYKKLNSELDALAN